MANLTLAEAKSYLRVVGTAEDTLITMLLANAYADIESYLGRCIATTTHTEKVRVGKNAKSIPLTHWPVTSVTSITDPYGNPFTSTLAEGAIITSAYILTEGEWTVVYTGGIDSDPRYASTIAPVLKACALDLVAENYQNRNPGQSNMGDSGFSAASFAGLPPRVTARLDRFRGI